MAIIILWKRLRIVGFCFIGGLILGLIFAPVRPLSGDQLYRIRDHFPPLVFLPGAEKGPLIHAPSGILIESKSGAVLFAKQAELRRAPASTTKIMTAIVALEIGNLEQMVTVSANAASTPGSSIWLRSGDRITLAELLKGMLIRSGNDGSIAVAEGISGSVAEFVKKMNLKAKEIGALHTAFNNPHGLRDVPHYTTALDLALIARYALANPHFARLVKQKTAVLNWAEKRQAVEIQNTNRLLWYLEGADGVKTGTTNEAGYCLVASATRDGRQLIAVVLNSRDRWGDCIRLLEYGFKEFDYRVIADPYHPVYQLRVVHGRQNRVALYPRSELTAVFRKSESSQITRKITIYLEPVSAPLYPGLVLGKMDYRFKSRVIEAVDLINHQAIAKKWWFW